MSKDFSDIQLEKIEQKMKDVILASHQAKASELSGLHRELLGKTKEVMDKLESNQKWHDSVDESLSNLTTFMARAERAVKAFENISWGSKAVLTICVSIGIIAGGLAGWRELVSHFK